MVSSSELEREPVESRARRAQAWDPAQTGPPHREALEDWWARFSEVYDVLVPIAEECSVQLAMHPSDVPLPDTPFGSLGLHRVIDAFPSRQVGYIYCVGTRAEAGGQSLVLDEIHHYGRQGRIFMLHLRNIRASLATAKAYEETALDDGDLNMFRVFTALREVGFDGCINPDHMSLYDADYTAGAELDSTPRLRKFLDASYLQPDAQIAHHGLAYSIGYIKALIAATGEVDGRAL